MLLKIGTRYIETGAITSIFDDGDSVTVYFNVTNDGDAARLSFKDDEYNALLRWLDAQATDIMATEPAPVETPRFKVGDNVLHIEHGSGKVMTIDGDRVELVFDLGEGVQSMRWINDLSEILVPLQPKTDDIPF